MTMEEVFPKAKLKTYSKSKRTVVKQKDRLPQHLESGSAKQDACKEGQTKTKGKRRNHPKKDVTKTAKRTKTQRAGKTKTGGKLTRKKHADSPQQENLTLGMFDNHVEDKNSDAGSSGRVIFREPVPVKQQQNDAENKMDKARDSLPEEEMEPEDRVAAWLSSQQDTTESSIEIMREETSTMTTRKKKCFPDGFYRNMDRVLHHVTDFKQTTHGTRHSLKGVKDNLPVADSFTGIEILSPTSEFTSTGITGQDPTNLMSTTAQSSQQTTGCTTGEQMNTEAEDAGLSPIPYEDHQQRNRVQFTAHGSLEEITLSDSLREKEKSEKTPGKRASFAVPGSPVKIHKVKHHKKSPPKSAPRSSTRLFLTNIDPAEELPQLSSIHGDADQESRFINSEVSGSSRITKVAVPEAPEVPDVRKFPLLTSTPNRKTSTPNKDVCQFTQFEFDLSSVSAVNSDEDGLLLPQPSRDVISDEHMDLSKTRIEEHLGEYVHPPATDKIVMSNYGRRSVTLAAENTKEPCEYEGTDIPDPVRCVDVEVHNRKRKTNPSKITTNKTLEITSQGKDANRVGLCGTEASHNSCHAAVRQRQSFQHLAESAFLSFNVKQKNETDFLKQNKLSGKRPYVTEICSLMSRDFVCPKRRTYIWQYHRDCKDSYRERVAILPPDDLL